MKTQVMALWGGSLFVCLLDLLTATFGCDHLLLIFFSITRLIFLFRIVTKSHLKFVTISIEMERNMCSLSHSMVCSGCVNSEIKLSGHSHFPSSPRINVVISIALIGLMQRERSEAEGGAWLQTDPRR